MQGKRKAPIKKIVSRHIWGMPLISVVAAAMLIAAPAEAEARRGVKKRVGKEADKSVSAKGRKGRRAKKGTHLVGVININTAGVKQLMLLPKIGKATAQGIVRERQKRPFKNTLEIVRVRGIGKKTFKKLERFLKVDGATTLTLARRVQKENKRR